MTWKSLLEKTKNLITSVVDKQQDISNNTENLDAKIVFQDTKKSLETLKQNIFSSTDELKKKQQEQHLSQYIDRLLWFSVLSQHDKTFLNQLKQNILSKTSLQEADLESIITIVSHLEQKAEHLDEVDQEKVKELHDTLSQHKKSLDLLKKWVAAVTPTLDEAKKKAFETMKIDLEKHRWSSWLAQPVYDYLVDKHINKKPVSKFKEFLIGTVGLTVVGWFVGKDLKDLISNIDTLKVEDIIGNPIISNAVENVIEYTEENIDIAKERFKPLLKNFVKKNTGKELTDEQMNRIMTKLDVWIAFKDSASEMQDVFKYLLTHNPDAADANIASASFSVISFPFTFSAKIFSVLKEEEIIWYEDIWLTVVNGMVEYGLKWFQLFWAGLWWVMGRIPFDQIKDKMATIYEKNNETANYLLFALMYRSTNSIFFKAISNTTAYIAKMALWPLVESSDDINSLKIIQDGYKSNIDETLKHLQKMQKVLPSAQADLIGDYIKHFNSTIAVLEESNNINKIVSSLKDWPNLIDDLKKAYRNKYGIDLPQDILKEITNKKALTKSDLFRKVLAPHIKNTATASRNYLNNPSFFYKAKLVFGKSPIQSLQKMNILDDATKQLDDVIHNFGNVVNNKGSSILTKGLLWGARSKMNLVNAGFNMAESVDRWVFAFDTIDDMKKFIDYSKTIAKTTPEALKFLIGKSPIFLIWGMALAKDWTMPEKVKELGKWLLGLVPIIWPSFLIFDSMKVSDINWTQASIGGALFITDAIYWVRNINKIWFMKSIFRGLARPIIDIGEILKAAYKSWVTVTKRVNGMATVMKTEWLLWFWKTFFAELLTLRRAAKLWVVAGLIYGWYCGVDYVLDNIKDKDIQDMVEKYKDNDQWLNNYLQKEWPTYDRETKQTLLAYSAGAQLGISPDKIKDIEVKYNKDTTRYIIKLPVVYSRDYLLPLKQNLENTLHIVELWVSVDFVISWSAQVDYEKTLKEQWYQEDEIKKQYWVLWYIKS